MHEMLSGETKKNCPHLNIYFITFFHFHFFKGPKNVSSEYHPNFFSLFDSLGGGGYAYKI